MFTPTKRDKLVILGTIAVLTVGIATTAACTPEPAPAAPAPTVTPPAGSAATIPLPRSVIDQFPDLSLAPCATEDAQNCYWDAATMGNGTGVSFINWAGTYYYAEAGK